MSGTAPTYLTSATAAPIAAQLPAGLLAAYLGASSDDQTAALTQASNDIDNAIVFQGRKYDLAQPLEFPRIAYRGTGRLTDFGMPTPVFVIPGAGDVVWDWFWDEPSFSRGHPEVPWDVRRAVIWQANSILDGRREERLGEQHDGVSDAGVGGLRESYRPASENPGLRTGLCRRAWRLIEKYRAVSGRML